MSGINKIFISHASLNFRLADEIRSLLEGHDIPCWIAPRDIPAGSSYSEQITLAIKNATALVLVLTDEANISRAVANELEMAFRYQKVIIPVRLRQVQPADSIAFFVNNAQWVDAFQSPLKQRVREIARIVNALAAGLPLPAADPERRTLLGTLERRIEGFFRYKAITLTAGVLLFAVLGLLSARLLMDVRTDTGQIVRQVDRVESAISEISANFDALRTSNSVISNPSRPEEFYSNAVYYEMRGDMLNARESYRRYFESPDLQVDPLERFTRMLSASEGRAGARESLRVLLSSVSSSLLEAYLYSLDEPGNAAQELSALIVRNPEIGPLRFLLARQYSEERLGRQSRGDQLREQDALRDFLAAHGRGEVIRYFIDQRMAADWISAAEARLNLLAGTEELAASLDIMPDNGGWNITLNANEPVRRAFYRINQSQPLEELPRMREIDQETREPMVQTWVRLPQTDLTEVEFYYEDLSGARRGPIKLGTDSVNPVEIVARLQKQQLDYGDLILFKEGLSAPIIQFLFANYTCAVVNARWGWGATPDNSLELSACNPEDPYGSQIQSFSLLEVADLPLATTHISIDLSFYDGSRTGILEFPIPLIFLELVQQDAESRQALADSMSRDNRFYSEIGMMLGAWDYAFGPCGPNDPCNPERANRFWLDAQQKLIQMGCIDSFRLRDQRSSAFVDDVRVEGARRASEITTAVELMSYLEQRCTAASKARTDLEAIFNATN
jgi:hypothetical protein